MWNLSVFWWRLSFCLLLFATNRNLYICKLVGWSMNPISHFFLLDNQLPNVLTFNLVINRRVVKCLNHLLRMISHLMNIANPWKRRAHGLDIWNCKQLPLLHTVIYAFTGWDLILPSAFVISTHLYAYHDWNSILLFFSPFFWAFQLVMHF
jgi:hypothetical protein